MQGVVVRLKAARARLSRTSIVALFCVLGLILSIAAISIPNLLRSRTAVTRMGGPLVALGTEAELAGDRLAKTAGTREMVTYSTGPVVEARRVARTGMLNLVVERPNELVERIRDIAVQLGGYVQSAELAEMRGGWPRASITIRVPLERFEDARTTIRNLGGRLENESDETRDVTGQYVDLQSALRNFRAEEAQYLEIMRRARSIKDTLAVAERLANVRGRIEQAQGQLNVLSRQTEMASLRVNLQVEPVTQSAELRWYPKQEVEAAFWDASRDFATYANFMIAVLFRLPVMLLWMVTVGAGLAAGWKMLRWMWRRFFAAAPAAA